MTMIKKTYIAPTARTFAIRTPRILAGSGETIPVDKEGSIGDGNEVGAKRGSFGLWEDNDYEE